jgi:putative protease
MKAKAKSSKSVKKKPAAKKKAVSTAGKKKTSPKSVKPKSVKKITTAKKTRKAAPGKKIKKPAAKKKVVSTAGKKKTSLKPVKKPVKKSAAIKKPPAAGTLVSIIRETFVSIATIEERVPPTPPSGLLVGKVTHYYNHSSVAIIELEAGNLHVGDTLQIKGHTTDFEQVIESMEIDHQNIETAEAGETIGVKVRDVVREHDKVYKK